MVICIKGRVILIRKLFSKLMNKYSIGYVIVAAFISFAIGIGMFWTATPVKHYEPQADDLIATYHVDSSTITNHATIDDNGLYTVEIGEDCWFEIDGIEKGGATVAIKFDCPMQDNELAAFVSVDYGDGYRDEEINSLSDQLQMIEDEITNEPAANIDRIAELTTEKEELTEELTKYSDYKLRAGCVREANYLCIQMPRNDYVGIRVRTSGGFGIESIEIHANEPLLVAGAYPKTPVRIVLGCVSGVFLLMVLVLLEIIWHLGEKIAIFLMANRKYFIQDIVTLILAVVVAGIMNRIQGGGEYSLAYNSFCGTAFLCVFILVRNILIEKLPTERTVFGLLMITGIAMVVVCPIGGWSWDVQSHYLWALQASGVKGSIGITDADLVMLMQKELTKSDYTGGYQQLNEWGQYVTTTTVVMHQINTWISGVAIAIARLFNIPFVWRYNMGRFAQVLVYSLCGYFGVKRLHSGKMIFTTVMFIPASMFLASNYSYDYWVTCFTMLGMAYFVGMCQEPDEDVRYKDVIIMCLAMAIGCVPKQIYVPIMIFPFLIAMKKIKDKKWIYYAICIIAFIVVFASFFMRSTTEISSAGDVRGGAVGPSDQLANIMAHPVWYLGLLFNFMKIYLNPALTNTGTFLAYLNTAPGNMILFVILLFVAITDKDEHDVKAYPILARLYAIPYFLGEVALMASALYLTFSPVGSEYMWGCQPRYVIPLLYPLFAIIFGRGINLKHIPKKYYYLVILGIDCIMLYYVMFHLMLPLSIR